MLIVSSISVIHELILMTLVLTSTLNQGPIFFFFFFFFFFIANLPLSHPGGDDKNSQKYM